ncbi:peptide/nickel transport system substrate-binding protein [Paenibacillus sp. UNC496MF]|uniref:ABC transporter substrate-binding protein n=1 Tax=Paenibacillus sp. UNC496MF TaxID=1502753 RepID=UPI0008EE6891|nr:ABC transporter substrate-binding protein [Paenibacillus sp. UNC496MF]SFI73800.1 peptide/nickel transport system substrate-binding protein [Paenibacillus sp. UNC496MF]
MRKKKHRSLALLCAVALILSAALSACDSGGGGGAEIGAINDTAKEGDAAGNAGGTNAKADNAKPENDADAAAPADEGAAPAEDVKLTDFKQSPALDSFAVALKDRLPEDYKITNEMPGSLLKYEVGTYGGTLRTVTSVVDWDADVFIMNDEALLNTPGLLGEEVTGNVLKSYEMSSDEKSFTFHMRKGLKWSDGQPVTTEDVRFAVEDVLQNKELTPIFPAWLNAGGDPNGKPFVFELIDEYTFKLSFDQPYGGFLLSLAVQGWRGYTDLLKPAHFLKNYHTKYTELAKLEPAIKKAGFKKGEWVNLFNEMDVTNWELTKPRAIGFPVLYPWMLTKKTNTTATFERNPYYFKVDSAGNQLPYIDKIQSTLVQDIEMVTLKTIAGEVDFSRESASLVKMPLYRENESKGFKAMLSNLHVSPTDIFLNLSSSDKNWAQVVNDVRFRKALSLALDRDEIIDSIYYGFAEKNTWQDSTYSVDEANKLLDEMGLKKGADGFRVGPDGKKFTIPIEVGAQAPDIVPMTELVVEMWKQLGLDVTMKKIDGTLWGKRNEANDLKATIIWAADPMWYYGDWGQGIWGPAWNLYNSSGGKKGVKPPADVAAFYQSLAKANVANPKDAKAIVDNEIKKALGDQFYFIVPLQNVKQPLIVNAKLHNVGNENALAVATDYAGEQLFFGK